MGLVPNKTVRNYILDANNSQWNLVQSVAAGKGKMERDRAIIQEVASGKPQAFFT